MTEFISTISSLYTITWTLAAIFGAFVRLPLAKSIQIEMRPLYLPAVVVAYVTEIWRTGDPWSVWHLLGLVFGVLNYFLFRGDDDDRWKRRRKKLAEKVERRGARLVVVTESAS